MSITQSRLMAKTILKGVIMWIVIFSNGKEFMFTNVVEAYEFFQSKVGIVRTIFYKKLGKNSNK